MSGDTIVMTEWEVPARVREHGVYPSPQITLARLSLPVVLL